jgi:hypothetical protein
MPAIAYSFVQTPGPSSWMIETFERGVWSHVDCVMPDGSLLGARSDRAGGQPPGVQVRPPDYEAWSKRDVVELDVTQAELNAWIFFLHAQIGKPYDTIDLLADFAAGRDWRNPDAWWCSELGAAAAEASGWLPEKIGQTVNFITPRDLYIIVTPWRSDLSLAAVPPALAKA